MNENETTGTPVPETTDTPTIPTAEENSVTLDTTEDMPPVAPVTETEAEEAPQKSSSKAKWIYSAIAIVIVILGLYGMEQTGKINTGLFSGVDNILFSGSAVAKVNGNKISKADFDTSVEQISAGAKAQGVDVTGPDVQADIQAQAIDMLVNTELLKQEALNRGIEITADDVQARYDELVTQLGGEEVLGERMNEFGVTEKILRRDIKNELTIQTLLEQIFAEKSTEVTEEEILALYNTAKESTPDIPALEEVRAQIEAQIKSSKEQEIVTSYVNSLREGAQIEVLI